MKKIYIILIGLILVANTNVFSQSFGSEITLEEVTVTASYNNNDWNTYWNIQIIITYINDYYDNNPGTTLCDGQVNSGAYYDDCGVCVGGTTGQSPCPPPQPPVDCHGDSGGSAYPAPCGCIGGNTGITECPPCVNPPFVSSDASIAGGAIPIVNISSLTVYGLTYPESVTVDITACLDAGSWKAILTVVTANYSQQVQLYTGVSEVGGTNASNYCKQVADLKALGYGPAGTIQWYMLTAVQAHENVHLTRFEPGIEHVATDIETLFEALSVPNTGQTEATAISQIKALPAYATAVASAYSKWKLRTDLLVSLDHVSGGPTDLVEQAIVLPVASSICSMGLSNSWPTCASCP